MGEEEGETRQEADRLQQRLVSEITRDFLAAQGDYDQLLSIIARRFSEIIGGLIAIRFLDKTGEHLEKVGSVYHPDPKLTAEVREYLLSTKERVGNSIAYSRKSAASSEKKEKEGGEAKEAPKTESSGHACGGGCDHGPN